MWCVGDCLGVFICLYMLVWMRFDWWEDQCAARKDIASLCMQVLLSSRNMMKNSLHMHQYVHNYRADFLATLMDCWPSLSKHWRAFKRGLSPAAQHSRVYHSMSLIKLAYTTCQNPYPLVQGLHFLINTTYTHSLTDKHLNYLIMFKYT